MSSSIHYRSVPENNEYILVKVICGLDKILADSKDVPDDVYTEVQTIYFGLFEFQHKDRAFYVHDPIAIRKNSLVGKYILEHDEMFIDDDTDVTYSKIVNAYNIATFSRNDEMINNILPIFMRRVSGSKKALSRFFKSEVLDYILQNSDFEEYLNKIDGKSSKKSNEYVVFEDWKYSKKYLDTKMGKIIVKNFRK